MSDYDKKAVEILGCLGVIFLALVVIVGLPLLFALPVMWLWNGLMPDITKGAVTEISFWQALGLSILCNILFKSVSTSSSSKSKS